MIPEFKQKPISLNLVENQKGENMKLHQMKCKPIHSGNARFNPDQIKEYLQELGNGWNVEDFYLKKHFTFKDFADALHFTNKVGEIAEQEGHHPDILLGWGKVVVQLTTHDAGGLTLNDFIMASKIEQLKS
jgi:4a-hydroxytetrahydrobiopterin dehydratase